MIKDKGSAGGRGAWEGGRQRAGGKEADKKKRREVGNHCQRDDETITATGKEDADGRLGNETET